MSKESKSNQKTKNQNKRTVVPHVKAIEPDLDIYKVPDSFIESQKLAQMRLESFRLANQESIKQIVLTNQRLMESSLLPFKEMSLRIEGFKTIQDQIIKLAQTSVKTISDSVFNSNITAITSAVRGVQIETLAGLYIKSDFQERMETFRNGMSEYTQVKKTKLIAGGQVRIGLEKKSSNITGKILYEKVENIEAQLQFNNETLTSNSRDIQLIKSILTEKGGLLYLLRHNPFPFFKIEKIEFIKNSSKFKINDAITVNIKSKTLQDYICQILFSGIKDNLTDEWDLEEIVEQLSISMGYAESEDMTWKKIQEAVSNVNIKIALETTIKDLIYSPRSETIQLNPEYFV